MREIKFRAWSTKHKIMFPHESFDEETDLSMLNDEESDVVYMQFTGLHDKNGKEIYEGDIVRWHVNGITRDGIVDYVDEAACFDMKNLNDDFYVCNDWFRGEYEVLGNIYENPELLEATP